VAEEYLSSAFRFFGEGDEKVFPHNSIGHSQYLILPRITYIAKFAVNLLKISCGLKRIEISHTVKIP